MSSMPLEIIESHAGICCGRCKGELEIITCKKHDWILKTICKKCGLKSKSYRFCPECLGLSIAEICYRFDDLKITGKVKRFFIRIITGGLPLKESRKV